jgi:hypothetical protein
MRAIETIGTIDAQGHIQLDNPQPQFMANRVRIVMMLDDPNDVITRPISLQTRSQPRIPGQDEGKVSIAHDFNDPLPEIILNSFLNPL